MENIFLTAYSNEERHTIINRIERVISKHGHIVDFMLFSDISLTMKIESEELKVDKLLDELKDNLRLEKFKYLNSVAKKERTIYLNITFAKGTGNLIIEVPATPG